jgi:hypothetical protein
MPRSAIQTRPQHAMPNKWTYSEQQFERGKLRYAMFSVCHITTGGE